MSTQEQLKGPIGMALTDAQERVRKARETIQTAQLELAKWESIAENLRMAMGLADGSVRPQAAKAPAGAGSNGDKAGKRLSGVNWQEFLQEVLTQAGGMTRAEIRDAFVARFPDGSRTAHYAAITKGLNDGWLEEKGDKLVWKKK